MKNLNEEVNKIKHLFKFKKGDVITESKLNGEWGVEYKGGDKLSINLKKGTIVIELTSDVSVNEPGNYSWDIKITESYDPKMVNKPASLEGYEYGDDNTISEYTIFVYDEKFTMGGGTSPYNEILNEDIKPNQIKKIN